ncbi:MAG: hypothetical protein U0414_41690 [Polyangiaceae bacterium]
MKTSTAARVALMAATSAGLSLAMGCSPSPRPIEEPVDVDPVGTAAKTSATVARAPSAEPLPSATAVAAPEGCTPEVYCRPRRTPPKSSGTGPPRIRTRRISRCTTRMAASRAMSSGTRATASARSTDRP